MLMQLISKNDYKVIKVIKAQSQKPSNRAE
nr:MAG TPA: hypothetical protein [Caudoviricetes sp.]